jgi:hypothetical protein
MIIAIWIVSLPLIAECIMAPINLWTGRTMPLFSKFTGFSPGTARRVFAPVKLTAAALIAVGLAFRPAGIAGAAITTAVCALYLVRLAAPGRRDASGVAAFLLFGALAVTLLALQLIR